MNNELILTNEETGYKRLYATLVDFTILFLCTSLIIYKKNIYTFLLFFVILELLYFTILEALTGYTLGKFIFRVKVINKDFQKPSILQSFIRAAFWLIESNPAFLVIPLIMFYIIQNTKSTQRLGDKVAGTYVVKTKHVNRFNTENLYTTSKTFSQKTKDFNEKLPDIYEEATSSFSFIKCKTYIKIIGLENMTYEELLEEVRNGKRFVVYPHYFNLGFLVVRREYPAIYFDKLSLKAIYARSKSIIISLISSIINLSLILDYMDPTIEKFSLVLIGVIFFFILPTIPAVLNIIFNIKGGNDFTSSMLLYINKKRDTYK